MEDSDYCALSVLGGRRKAQREGLRCKVESDAVEGTVVETTKVLLAPILGKGNSRLTTGLCAFRVIDRGKSEVRLPSSRDQGHLEVLLDCACTERATGDRESSTLVDRFLNDRWLAARSMKCEGKPYRWTDGKLADEMTTSGMCKPWWWNLARRRSIRKCRSLNSVGGRAGAANAQNVVRSPDACAIMAWTAEIVGRVVSKSL